MNLLTCRQLIDFLDDYVAEIFGQYLLHDLRYSIEVTIDGHIAVVEMQRPPHNYFDTVIVKSIADAYDSSARTEVFARSEATSPFRRGSPPCCDRSRSRPS